MFNCFLRVGRAAPLKGRPDPPVTGPTWLGRRTRTSRRRPVLRNRLFLENAVSAVCVLCAHSAANRLGMFLRHPTAVIIPVCWSRRKRARG